MISSTDQTTRTMGNEDKIKGLKHTAPVHKIDAKAKSDYSFNFNVPMEENLDDLFGEAGLPGVDLVDFVDASSSSSSASAVEKTLSTNQKTTSKPFTSPSLPTLNTQIPKLHASKINIPLELTRHRRVAEISTFLQVQVPGLKMAAFQRWLVDSRRVEEEENSSSSVNRDPVIPSVYFNSNLSNEMQSLFVGKGHEPEKAQSLARRTVNELVDLCKSSIRSLNGMQKLRNGMVSVNFDKVEKEGGNGGAEVAILKYPNKIAGKPYVLTIGKGKYLELVGRFNATADTFLIGSSNSRDVKDREIMKNQLILQTIVRYSSFSGGHSLSKNVSTMFDSYMTSSLHSILDERFGRCMEVFASPFDLTFGNTFTSAFPELDSSFGSVGSFFNLSGVSDGCYICNPPASPKFCNDMVSKITDLLGIADQKKKCVTFVVMVGTEGGGGMEGYEGTNQYKKKKQEKRKLEELKNGKKNNKGKEDVLISAMLKSYSGLLASRFRVKNIILNANEHGILEGSQHLNPSCSNKNIKFCPINTSIIILQSTLARKEFADCKGGWGEGDELVELIRDAARIRLDSGEGPCGVVVGEKRGFTSSSKDVIAAKNAGLTTNTSNGDDRGQSAEPKKKKNEKKSKKE